MTNNSSHSSEHSMPAPRITLPQLARFCAEARRTSIIMLEIVIEGERHIACEDAQAFFVKEEDRAAALQAYICALEEMHCIAVKRLQEELAADVMVTPPETQQ